MSDCTCTTDPEIVCIVHPHRGAQWRRALHREEVLQQQVDELLSDFDSACSYEGACLLRHTGTCHCTATGEQT